MYIKNNFITIKSLTQIIILRFQAEAAGKIVTTVCKIFLQNQAPKNIYTIISIKKGSERWQLLFLIGKYFYKKNICLKT